MEDSEVSTVAWCTPSRYTLALPQVGPTGPTTAMIVPVNLKTAVALVVRLQRTLPPMYESSEALDQPELQLAFELPSLVMVATRGPIVFHDPMRPDLSVARTRKASSPP